MFPINSNDAFIDKNGKRTTIGNKIESGGSGGSDLPDYDEGDAGKVLGVDEEGLLEWKTLPGGAKIYYKDYNVGWANQIQVAKFENDAASAGGIFIGRPPGNSGYRINIAGYSAISAVAKDNYTGYQYGVLLEWSSSLGYQISLAFGRTSMTGESMPVRVFYVKDEIIEALT